jgi:hypothetical protein
MGNFTYPPDVSSKYISPSKDLKATKEFILTLLLFALLVARKPVRNDMCQVRSPEFERGNFQGYMHLQNPNFPQYYSTYDVPCYHGVHYVDNGMVSSYPEHFMKIPSTLQSSKLNGKRSYDFEGSH